MVLILSGNLSFLNWLTIMPSLACLDDCFYQIFFGRRENSKMWTLLKMQYFSARPDSKTASYLRRKDSISSLFRKATNALLLVLIAYLSWPVVSNLLSPKQAMNTSFEPFRIVNTYGAFGR